MKTTIKCVICQAALVFNLCHSLKSFGLFLKLLCSEGRIVLRGRDIISFQISLTFRGTQVDQARSSGLVGRTSRHGASSWHEGNFGRHDKQWVVNDRVREGSRNLGAYNSLYLKMEEIDLCFLRVGRVVSHHTPNLRP